MELRELRYFAAVYEDRNVTAAARRCFVSQPSVSAAVASLESELNTRLFIRHRKGAIPTADAETFYVVARRILDEAQAARRLFQPPEREPQVTIGLMRSLDIARTMKLLRPLTEAPGLGLRLVGEDERCDARVISKSLRKDKEAFVPLWTEAYVVAIPATHALALKDSLTVADLDGQPLINRCHCESSPLFERANARLQTAAVAQSEEWALALVAAGIGLAILPEGVARASTGIALRRVKGVQVTRQVGLAYGASGAPPAPLKRFIDGLRGSSAKTAPRKRTARR